MAEKTFKLKVSRLNSSLLRSCFSSTLISYLSTQPSSRRDELLLQYFQRQNKHWEVLLGLFKHRSRSIRRRNWLEQQASVFPSQHSVDADRKSRAELALSGLALCAFLLSFNCTKSWTQLCSKPPSHRNSWKTLSAWESYHKTHMLLVLRPVIKVKLHEISRIVNILAVEAPKDWKNSN